MGKILSRESALSKYPWLVRVMWGNQIVVAGDAILRAEESTIARIEDVQAAAAIFSDQEIEQATGTLVPPLCYMISQTGDVIYMLDICESGTHDSPGDELLSAMNTFGWDKLAYLLYVDMFDTAEPDEQASPGYSVCIVTIEGRTFEQDAQRYYEEHPEFGIG